MPHTAKCMKQHFQQIDVVKGLAIVCVLLLHTFPKSTLVSTYAVYHIWQAVPLFLVVMGLNLGLATTGKAQPLNSLYSKNYFSKKATRMLIPFLQVFFFALLLGVVWERITGRDVLEVKTYALVGLLPVTGPGNYFITLLLQSILFLPLIGYCFGRKPIGTTLVLVLLEIAFLLWSKQSAFFRTEKYLYSAALPRYFSAIAYGLWIAKAIYQGTKLVPLVLLTTAAVLSAFVLYVVRYTGFSFPLVPPVWQLQQVLTFGYAAWLVWMALLFLPSQSENRLLKALAGVGKASYHIFLVQIVYFGLMQQTKPHLALNLAVCLLLGYLYFIYERRITDMLCKPIHWLKASRS